MKKNSKKAILSHGVILCLLDARTNNKFAIWQFLEKILNKMNIHPIEAK
jgi:hypothetical protein